MSVIAVNDTGWLIDHKRIMDDTFSLTVSCKYHSASHINKACCSSKCFSALPALFDIYGPFIMDSCFINKKSASNDNDTELDATLKLNNKTKRCRKRIRQVTESEIAYIEFHTELKCRLKECLNKFLIAYDSNWYFQPKYNQVDNNQAAREAAKIPGFGNSLSSLTGQLKSGTGYHSEPLELTSLDCLIVHSADLCNRLITYSLSAPCVACVDGHEILIPANCRFLQSDITFMQPLLNDNKNYDCIVIDPPWPNKSIKRKKVYNALSEWDLLQLPVTQLTKHGTIVVVWVTNKLAQQKFVKDTLFMHWHVDFLSQWHWLKITKSGQPVLELNDSTSSKRPYESLLIGRVQLQGATNEPSSLPQNRVIVSVPCSIHSRKPPLTDVLSCYLPLKAECLELFARNLLPGWTSWGNEVLAFQHVDFFSSCDVKTDL